MAATLPPAYNRVFVLYSGCHAPSGLQASTGLKTPLFSRSAHVPRCVGPMLWADRSTGLLRRGQLPMGELPTSSEVFMMGSAHRESCPDGNHDMS